METYFQLLPQELIFEIFQYLQFKKDIDNFSECLNITNIQDTFWRSLGNQNYPGYHIKTKNEYLLNAAKTELYIHTYNRQKQIDETIKINFTYGKVKLFAVNRSRVFIITTDNQVYLYGKDVKTELFSPTETYRKLEGNYGNIIQISCRAEHSAILNDKG